MMRRKLAAILVCCLPLPAAATTRILVPAYFDPAATTYWTTLASSVSSQVPITAIMNPDDGPTKNQSSAYTTAIANFTTAGGTVVGYVYTDDGSRSLTAVEKDIATYKSQYPAIGGIFVDQMSNSSGELTYYQNLYSYIKTNDPGWQVIGNPGASTLSSYLSPTQTADQLVTYENSTGYSTYTPSSWQSAYQATTFANIAYNVSGAATMEADLAHAQSISTGSVYFTDMSGSNPYAGLPSYWAEEVAAVAAANGATSVAAYIATGSGNYSTAGNWSAAVPNGINAEAEFLGAINAAHTVYSDSPITLGKIVFNNSATYVLAGAGSLSLETTSGSAGIDAQAGTQEITLPITVVSNAVFSAEAGAKLIIAAPVQVDAGANLSESGSGTVSFTSPVTILTGGSATLTPDASLASLNLAASSTAIIASSATSHTAAVQVDSLSLASQSVLNLNGQDMIVHNGNLTELTAMSRAGQLASSGSTSGPDALAIVPNDGSGPIIVSSFDGSAVTTTDVLIRSTVYGDADLTGTVDADDFAKIDAGFAQHLTGWSNGDFNYDGVVDGSDFTLIDSIFDANKIQTNDLTAGSEALISNGPAVPEPASSTLLITCVFGACAGSRRCRDR